MAILRSHGLLIVDAIPVHTPVDDQAILAWDKVLNLFYYYDSGWQTVPVLDDSLFVHKSGAENITGVKTFTVDPVVPAETYGVGWDGSNEVPTKNDVYDKIQELVGKLPVYIYKNTISQTGTSNPTGATPAINNLGETPSFIRNDVGEYELNVVGTQFTAGKTIVHATLINDSAALSVKVEASAANKISFVTLDDANAPIDFEGDLFISIEVWV